MSTNYLAEAFKEMKLLESESFSFDKSGAVKLGDFMEDDTLNDFDTVIDPEATTEDELQESYLGMGILKCEVCHSLIYKAKEEITVDEENQLANVGELCPYCFSGDGFNIVGQVAPFEDITVEAAGDVSVKVDGKDVAVSSVESDEMKVEEEIESEQKFPVESPVGEVREDLQKAPKKRWNRVTEEVTAKEVELEEGKAEKLSDRLKRKLCIKTEGLKENFDNESDVKAWNDISIKNLKTAAKELGLDNFDMKDLGKDKIVIIASKGGKNIKKETSHLDAYEFRTAQDAKEFLEFELGDALHESLTEGMEDISITTDDTVIKVKATPREDKETIVPVTPTEIETATANEEIPTEGEETEMTDVDIEEIDEAGFDELGESYLKKVYENVQSYKTTGGSLRGNKIKLEGLITFNSGKKAKTNFIFEAKEMTKKGKLKFIGENLNLTKNRKAFTLTGRTEGKKLVCENFNYNYLAKDDKGTAKRLYGTIKR